MDAIEAWRDVTDKDCAPRNKLREFARNLYIESEDVLNSFTGGKKNHGIICASVLGTVAIVLNLAGAGNGGVIKVPYLALIFKK